MRYSATAVEGIMWAMSYSLCWCGTLKETWAEKCISQFIRWKTCHWTLLWKRISSWYYCSVFRKIPPWYFYELEDHSERRLHEFGLRRENEVHSGYKVWDWNIIKREIEGLSSPLGYSGMWNRLMCCCLFSLIHCVACQSLP